MSIVTVGCSRSNKTNIFELNDMGEIQAELVIVTLEGEEIPVKHNIEIEANNISKLKLSLENLNPDLAIKVYFDKKDSQMPSGYANGLYQEFVPESKPEFFSSGEHRITILQFDQNGYSKQGPELNNVDSKKTIIYKIT